MPKRASGVKPGVEGRLTTTQADNLKVGAIPAHEEGFWRERGSALLGEGLEISARALTAALEPDSMT